VGASSSEEVLSFPVAGGAPVSISKHPGIPDASGRRYLSGAPANVAVSGDGLTTYGLTVANLTTGAIQNFTPYLHASYAFGDDGVLYNWSGTNWRTGANGQVEQVSGERVYVIEPSGPRLVHDYVSPTPLRGASTVRPLSGGKLLITRSKEAAGVASFAPWIWDLVLVTP
jgi:hypothetical protein